VSVDAAPPQVTIAAPTGTTHDTSLSVAWGATDSGAGVARYDVDVSIDGGPFSPWLNGTTDTAALYPAVPGRRYRFRARAVDAFGNLSPYVDGGEVLVAEAAAPPVPGDAKVVVGSVKRRSASLTVLGRLDPSASGTMTAVWRAKAGRKRVVARKATSVGSGRFEVRLRIPRAARRARRATLTLRYSGDARFAQAQHRLALRHSPKRR
jgi:hypothetical protein